MAASRLLEDYAHHSCRHAQAFQNPIECAIQARAADHGRKGWSMALPLIHVCLGGRSGAGTGQGGGPESCQKCWESWREGFLCCSNTSLCWKGLRYFILDSWLLTCVPIKSGVNINTFIHSQPVTSVLTDCSGEQGSSGQVANSPCTGTRWALFPGSRSNEGQLLNSGTQTLALEIANFSAMTKHKYPTPV